MEHIGFAELSEGRTHQIPVAVGILEQFAMTGALYYKFAFVTIGQDGVSGIADIRPPDVFRSGDGDHVAVFGSAFGDHQIV